MHIKYVDGHYEIVSADNGQFIQSADTWDEALDDMHVTEKAYLVCVQKMDNAR